jgi:hypothetical protein
VIVRRSKARPWLFYDLARSPYSRLGELFQKPQRAAPANRAWAEKLLSAGVRVVEVVVARRR